MNVISDITDFFHEWSAINVTGMEKGGRGNYYIVRFPWGNLILAKKWGNPTMKPAFHGGKSTI